VTSGSTASLLLSLSNNTTTSGVTVTITSTNNGVAVPVYTPCVLSDEPGSTSSCEIQVKGLASGSATVTASAPGVKSASATVAVSTASQPGTLGFTPTAEQVSVGSVQHVTVKLSGSSGVAGQSVTIASSDTTKATVTPSVVVLSTDAPTQTITIAGVLAGTAPVTVTASAAGYASATNAVTVGATPAPGKLAFAGNVNLAVGESKGGTLSLQGSSNVSPFTATLTPDNAGVTVVPATCPLSTATRTCPFTIKGNLAGSTKITAKATSYTPVTMIAQVSQDPMPGNFYFSAAQETVVIGTPGSVTLTYSGGSGVVNLPVTLSTNNGNATISPLSCPMSNTGANSTCNITITGVTASPTPTVITAGAPGYTSAQNTVNVQASGPLYGNLSFSSANVPVPLGGNVQLTLTLNNSSGVTSLPVTLAPLPSGTVNITTTPSPCVLSTASNTCAVNVYGTATGSTTLTATSTAGPTTPISAAAAVTVGAALTPSLVFTPDPLVLIEGNPAASQVTLSMANPPVNPVTVTFTYDMTILGMSVIPLPCVLSAATPTCALSINHWNPPVGVYPFLATPSDPTILPKTLNVSVATLQPNTRTLTVTNNCPYTVWAGMSGGAVASVTPYRAASQAACLAGATFANGYCCPTGSSTVKGDLCYWNSPTPDNGYMLPTVNGVRTTHFTIPSDSLTTATGLTHIWSGGITARRECHNTTGVCAVGGCDDNQGGGLACVTGVGFNTPATVAEFTLLRGGSDAYDVQIITGVTTPMSMGPTSPMQDPGNPFTGGVAGSTQSQVGSQYTLNPATWTFTPPQIGTPASIAYLTLVDGEAGVISTCSDAQPCTTGVCGYATNSFSTVNHATPQGPTYTLTCGNQLGWLTADAIYKGNTAGSLLAPLNFNSVPGTDPSLPYPNVNGYTLGQFVDCPHPPMESGYQAATTYPHACGCTNWTGIATPTSTCQGTGATGYTTTTPSIGFNSGWIEGVYPLLTWLKTGCPTCYTYQFDDASSSFQAYLAQSSTNGSNSVDYTITFCP
jgi:hypothetical protein